MENERKPFPENRDGNLENEKSNLFHTDQANPHNQSPDLEAEEPWEDEIPNEVIEKKNDRPAANTIKWAIIIAIIVMLLVYYFVFLDRDLVSDIQ